MARKARLTCICYVEIIGANEYEALSEVEEMIEREYPLSDKTTLIIKETITPSSEGCEIKVEKQ